MRVAPEVLCRLHTLQVLGGRLRAEETHLQDQAWALLRPVATVDDDTLQHLAEMVLFEGQSVEEALAEMTA